MKNVLELRAVPAYGTERSLEGSHRRLDTSHARVVTASGPVCAKTGVSHGVSNAASLDLDKTSIRCTLCAHLFSFTRDAFSCGLPIRVCVTHTKLYVRVVANWFKF